MKKTITYGLFIFCFSLFASCIKDVKAPSKTAGNATAATTTTNNSGTTPSSQDQGNEHTCGGSHNGNSGNGY